MFAPHYEKNSYKTYFEPISDSSYFKSDISAESSSAMFYTHGWVLHSVNEKVNTIYSHNIYCILDTPFCAL